MSEDDLKTGIEALGKARKDAAEEGKALTLKKQKKIFRKAALDVKAKVLKKALQKYESKIRKKVVEFTKKFANTKKKDYGQVFDPDVVAIDIQRWYENYKREELKDIGAYKTSQELHEAMQDYRTKSERALEAEAARREEIEKGLTRFGKDGKYEAFIANNPAVLSHLAQGSNWCIQNPATAEQYLKDKGDFKVVYKDGKPLVAIHDEPNRKRPGVWLHTDFNLRNGGNYTRLPVKPIILREDFDYINQFLEKSSLKI